MLLFVSTFFIYIMIRYYNLFFFRFCATFCYFLSFYF
uniref:Uncharacterized protein n=1 Tax=Ophidocladus simpliciusculus TaxID=1261574 RepID=A0A1Z1MJ37_9FLOR|nr:hypothetical protein [Ophidocladus simpliciusculus]ARW65899.1 hypothetical protein [Ophidocladus simpliciusculus]